MTQEQNLATHSMSLDFSAQVKTNEDGLPIGDFPLTCDRCGLSEEEAKKESCKVDGL